MGENKFCHKYYLSTKGVDVIFFFQEMAQNNFSFFNKLSIQHIKNNSKW